MKNFLRSSETKDNPALEKVLSGRLRRLKREKKFVSLAGPAWPAVFFGLERSSLFVKMQEAGQQRILSMCSSNLLLESWLIEKIGMAFCARMSLASETTESAQMYCLIGADEATHFRWLSPFVPVCERKKPALEFINFLTDIVSEADPFTLVFPLQIVLEGWGIRHYQSLAAHCMDPLLQDVFADIVRDEALHQQAGIALFEPEKLSKRQTADMLDMITTLLEMVRLGPRAIAAAVETVAGCLSVPDKIRLLNDMAATETTFLKLQQIRQTMLIPGYAKIVEYLEAKKLFTPLPVRFCV